VLHVQIDRLSSVNGIYGRGQGDAVLAGIAQRLRSCIRGGDLAAVNPMAQEAGVVARLGDSAFSILIFVLVALVSIISFRQTKALEELN